MTAGENEPRHCDDYIEDVTQPAALRAFLEHARSPAHGNMRPGPKPKLFARYDGRPVRVVMASRLGDVGFTYDLTREHGYERRAHLDLLTDFTSEAP